MHDIHANSRYFFFAHLFATLNAIEKHIFPIFSLFNETKIFAANYNAEEKVFIILIVFYGSSEQV